jgi:hypothetical protein
MDKPKSFIIDNNNVYIAQDIYNYDTAFFTGVCGRMRLIVEKLKLKESDYCWGYIKNNIWIKSNSKYPKAKLLLNEEYVINNIPKMMDKVKQELYKYEEAPSILELTNDEKFKDNNNNIINIEVRGERESLKCYFKVKDISINFCMLNLNTVLLNNKNSYDKNIDYKCFTVNNEYKTKKNLFLTYIGLQKCIYINRKNFSSKLKLTMTKWLQQFDNTKLKNYNIGNFYKAYSIKIGVVYCVTSNILNAIKIGFWTGSIDGLRKRYITSYGNNIELNYFNTINPRELENECHLYFNKYKITNELFEKDYLQKYINYLELNKITPTKDDLNNINNDDISLEYTDNNDMIYKLEKQLIDEKNKNISKDNLINVLKQNMINLLEFKSNYNN